MHTQSSAFVLPATDVALEHCWQSAGPTSDLNFAGAQALQTPPSGPVVPTSHCSRQFKGSLFAKRDVVCNRCGQSVQLLEPASNRQIVTSRVLPGQRALRDGGNLKSEGMYASAGRTNTKSEMGTCYILVGATLTGCANSSIRPCVALVAFAARHVPSIVQGTSVART